MTPTCPPGMAPALFRGMPAHFSDSAQTEACYHMLSRPQPPPDPLLLQRLPRPSSLLDKTQLHSRCPACPWSWATSLRCPPLPGLTPDPGLLFAGLSYMCARPQAPPSPRPPSAVPQRCPGSALTPLPPGGWTHRGASCSRASGPGTRSGCASSTTASSTWIPRWAGPGRAGGWVRDPGTWVQGSQSGSVSLSICPSTTRSLTLGLGGCRGRRGDDDPTSV